MNQSREPRREVWALCAFLFITTISGFVQVHDSKSAMVSGHSGIGKQLRLQRTFLSPVSRDVSLEMQPKVDSTNSAGGTGSTVLRYKNLSQQEEQDLGLVAGPSWVEKWFEDHLPQFPSWKVDDVFPRGQSKKKRIHNKLIEVRIDYGKWEGRGRRYVVE